MKRLASERLFERGMRAVGQMAEACGCLQSCSPPSALFEFQMQRL